MALLQFIYFQGCPNAEKAFRMMTERGFRYTSVCQDDLPAGHFLKGYSSPTLLGDGEIIFGSRTSGDGGGCSLAIPALEDVLERLKRVPPDAV